MPRTAPTLDDLLAPEPPELRDLTAALRDLIRSEVPAATERANLGWRSLNFSHPQAGYFLGLFPRKDHLLLVFEFGVLLDDPDGILEGNGAQVRQITLRPGDPIPAAALRRLMRGALDLPTNRAARLALLDTRRRGA